MNRGSWSRCWSLLLIGAALPSCAAEVVEEDASVVAPAEEGPAEAPDRETSTALPAQEMATFQLANGSRIRYVGSLEARELTYIEEHAIGSPRIMGNERTPLDVYLQLAPADAPVPRLLAELDEGAVDREARLQGRTLVDAVEGVFEVAAEKLPPPLFGAQAVINSCGANGADHFEDHHCYYRNEDLIAPNRHDALWACDEGLWSLLLRSTDSWRKNSYSETAACGADVRVTHYHRFAGEWYHLDDSVMTVPDNHVWYMFRMGGGWFPRRVRHDRLGDEGGLRGYSEFSNP